MSMYWNSHVERVLGNCHFEHVLDPHFERVLGFSFLASIGILIFSIYWDPQMSTYWGIPIFSAHWLIPISSMYWGILILSMYWNYYFELLQ